MTTSVPTCPKCRESQRVLPILWGMPNFDDDLSNVYVGGCIVPDLEPWPEWHCEACEHEWV